MRSPLHLLFCCKYRHICNTLQVEHLGRKLLSTFPIQEHGATMNQRYKLFWYILVEEIEAVQQSYKLAIVAAVAKIEGDGMRHGQQRHLNWDRCRSNEHGACATQNSETHEGPTHPVKTQAGKKADEGNSSPSCFELGMQSWSCRSLVANWCRIDYCGEQCDVHKNAGPIYTPAAMVTTSGEQIWFPFTHQTLLQIYRPCAGCF